LYNQSFGRFFHHLLKSDIALLHSEKMLAKKVDFEVKAQVCDATAAQLFCAAGLIKIIS
jgi:hypothetical protein